MRNYFFVFAGIVIALCLFSFTQQNNNAGYKNYYKQRLKELNNSFTKIRSTITQVDPRSESGRNKISSEIAYCRTQLKALDIWLRYLEPVTYKLLNGPLPVEWETEVFEKFEKPYKREGSGLTLLELYLEETDVNADTLLKMLDVSLSAFQVFNADSITRHLSTPDHFFLCNRLHLLNLAAIYTTGFECPNTNNIRTELQQMLMDTRTLYSEFNGYFPAYAITSNYLKAYDQLISFVKMQSSDMEQFDHFTFIKDHVNPLFALNQRMINDYKVVSRSHNDYSLSKQVNSIFSKFLYHGQNTKGVFSRVQDAEALAVMENLGKNLFYDPILSGNNLRSCSSCHIPSHFFTDTTVRSAMQYNRSETLQRNTPSLLNSNYNHLLMHDGFHISLQNQAKAVIANPIEMGANSEEVLNKVKSVSEYAKAFEKLLKYTPQEKELTMEHIASVLTHYYSKFSFYYSPFDMAMNNKAQVSEDVKKGFNIFMSKAQCATCHFVPQFNGVKPPYVGSEFEVLGVPADVNYTSLSADRGRYEVNPAKETLRAFRTGTLRNSMKTMPYMHNGVFKTMDEVLEFYNGGGGAGRGLKIDNQTLSSDSLKLTESDKYYLKKFLESLTESIPFEPSPSQLPVSKKKELNTRKVNGEY